MSQQYERARAVLVTHFGGLSPPLFRRALVELQRSALEDAIRDVENGCMTLAASARTELELERTNNIRSASSGDQRALIEPATLSTRQIAHDTQRALCDQTVGRYFGHGRKFMSCFCGQQFARPPTEAAYSLFSLSRLGWICCCSCVAVCWRRGGVMDETTSTYLFVPQS